MVKVEDRMRKIPVFVSSYDRLAGNALENGGEFCLTQQEFVLLLFGWLAKECAIPYGNTQVQKVVEQTKAVECYPPE